MKLEMKQKTSKYLNKSEQKSKYIKGFGISLIVFFVVFAFLYVNRTPEFLKNSSDVQNQVLRFKSHDSKFAIFYPDDQVISQQIDLVIEDIKTDLISKQLDKDLYKVDSDLSIINERYYSTVFSLSNEINTVFDTYINLYDNQLKEEIVLYDVINHSLKVQLSNDLRFHYKSKKINDEKAYTNEFLELTQVNQPIYQNLYLTNDSLVLVVNPNELFNEEVIEISYKLEDVVNYLNLDLKITSSNKPLISQRYVDPSRPIVALTFDDGPVAVNTTIAIEALQKYDSSASFFMLGNLMHQNHDLIRRMISEGQEIATHSYNHPKLTRYKDEEKLDFQLNENQRILDEITNSSYEIKLFRPPYGAYNLQMLSQSTDAFIMWSLDTLDWKTRNIEETHKTIVENVKDGDIILMHDLHYESVMAIDNVLKSLVDMGYQVVSVSEMMNAKGIELIAGESYESGR